MVLCRICLIVCLFGSAFGAPAQQLLGKFGIWRVALYPLGDETSCVVSARTKDKGASILITRKANSSDPVVVTFGLRGDVNLNKPLEARIGPRIFPLMAKDGRAWAVSDKDEQRLLAAMEAGDKLTVLSTSIKGKRQQETYPLVGFATAWSKVFQECTPK